MTPIGQVRRLRELAEKALTNYDLDVIGMTLIAQSFNTVYRIRCRGAGPHLLRVGASIRVHPPDSDNMAGAWQCDLMDDLGLKVPQHVSGTDRCIVHPVSLSGISEPTDCAVLTWVPGRAVGPKVTVEQAELSGRLLAQLHEHASEWVPPRGLTVPIADRVTYLGDDVLDTLTRYRSLYLEARDRAR